MIGNEEAPRRGVSTNKLNERFTSLGLECTAQISGLSQLLLVVALLILTIVDLCSGLEQAERIHVHKAHRALQSPLLRM